MTTLQLNEILARQVSEISGDQNLLSKAVNAMRRILEEKRDRESMNAALSSPEMLQILKEGDEQIAKGNVKHIKIDDLWK